MAKAARILLYCLLVWAPLPLASNRPIFWAVNGAVASLILILFVAGELGRPARQDFDWRPAAFASAAFLIVILWMAVQTLPLPAPLSHPAWSEIAGGNGWGAISVKPSATWTAIAQILPIGFLALVAMRSAVDRKRSVLLLNIVVAATTGVALYGMAAQYIGFEQVFLVDSNAYAGFLTGTFVGRNAAATYFVIGISAATSLIAARLESVFGRSSRHDRRGWMVAAVAVPRQAGLYLIADLVLAAALLNTGSRGGAMAGGIALLTIALLSLRRTSADRRALAATFAGIVALVFIIAAVSSDLLVQRLQVGDAGASDRVAVYRDTLDMIAERPILGHGGGAFEDAYPLYHQRAPSEVVWNHAHDTYLQIAAGIGLPAFAVFIAGIVAVVGTILLRIGKAGEPRPAAVAALAVAAATAFHSVVDFSLEIQAVGLTAAVLIGAGLGDVLRMPRTRKREGSTPGAVEAINQRNTVNVTIPSVRATRETTNSA